jgi:hypothetical protein
LLFKAALHQKCSIFYLILTEQDGLHRNPQSSHILGNVNYVNITQITLRSNELLHKIHTKENVTLIKKYSFINRFLNFMKMQHHEMITSLDGLRSYQVFSC